MSALSASDSDFMPSELADEDRAQAAWFAEHGGALLDAVVTRELASGERVVAVNAHWLAVVPFWASWPFEVLLIARDAVVRIEGPWSPEAWVSEPIDLRASLATAASSLGATELVAGQLAEALDVARQFGSV